MKEKIEQKIEKWENNHSILLRHHNSCSTTQGYPEVVLRTQRSTMKLILEIIEDLKQLKTDL